MLINVGRGNENLSSAHTHFFVIFNLKQLCESSHSGKPRIKETLKYSECFKSEQMLVIEIKFIQLKSVTSSSS